MPEFPLSPMPFRRTCKQTAALLVAREDRALPWNDRLALRLHLAVCQACPRFEQQMLLMRKVMRRWREADPD